MTDLIPLDPLTKAQTALLLNLVRRAAQAEIMPRFSKLAASEIDTKSGPQDLVTQADHAAEAMIARGLSAAFPGAEIVGEETAGDLAEAQARLAKAPLGFTIDPVDGTWNFAHGVPTFASMIAACRYGVPVFGLILDPITGDAAIAGMNGPAQIFPRLGAPRPLHTAAPKPLAQMTGFIDLPYIDAEYRRTVAVLACDLHEARGLRCSAYQYRLVAQGAVDFNLHNRLNPWDHMPGTRLVQQAGGHVAMLDGTPYDASVQKGFLLSASSQEVWERVRDHFAEALL